MESHVALVSAVCLVAALAGCGKSGPARAPIQGMVTVGGRPLAAGRILFRPLAPSTGTAASAAIKDGVYRLPAGEGPVVGPNRVEIEAGLHLGFALDDEAAYAKRGGRPLPPNPIPPQFNRQSQLVVEVKTGEENRYDLYIPGPRQAVARPTPPQR
jgi:hypothetical protein